MTLASANAPSAPAARNTPFPGARLALGLLLAINLVNYLDRQVLAAVVRPIKETFFGANVSSPRTR